MTMSVVYTTINGQIVQENRGGVQSFYAPDTLGSTVALLSATGTVTDTFTYWPFGESQNHTGTSVTPFTYGGTLCYYQDILNSFFYVRKRILRQNLTRWQTADPLWPRQPAYNYVHGSPVSQIDYFGMFPSGQHSTGPVPSLPVRCNKQWSNYLRGLENRCNSLDDDNSVCIDSYNDLVDQYNQACSGGGLGPPGPEQYGCENMAKHWCERHSVHGSPTTQWRSSCYECCGLVYDSVQGTPIGSKLLEQCYSTCDSGGFVPPASGFRPPAETVIPPILDRLW